MAGSVRDGAARRQGNHDDGYVDFDDIDPFVAILSGG